MTVNLSILENEYVAIGIALFVALYGITIARIQLPDQIKNLFNNNIFRVVFLSLLLIHNFNSAPHVGVAIALIFIITMYYLNEQQIQEDFNKLETFRVQIKQNHNH